MKTIGSTNGNKVVYSDKSKAMYIKNTEVAFYGVKTEQEAKEKAKRYIENFIEA